MSGLVLLFAVAMIAAVIIWSIMNDKVGTVGQTRGLFAMRDDGDSEGDAAETEGPDTPYDKDNIVGRR